MGRAQQSGRTSKRKPEGGDEIEKLREENKQLRELVAHLSKLAVVQIIEPAESGE